MIDQKKRDKIIGKGAKWMEEFSYAGGIALFSEMTCETLKKLVKLKYASLDECQNNGPEIKDFIEFMENNPGFTANGYAVEAERDDCRVTITGLDFIGKSTPEQRSALRKFCHNDDVEASELIEEKTKLYSWWD